MPLYRYSKRLHFFHEIYLVTINNSSKKIQTFEKKSDLNCIFYIFYISMNFIILGWAYEHIRKGQH